MRPIHPPHFKSRPDKPRAAIVAISTKEIGKASAECRFTERHETWVTNVPDTWVTLFAFCKRECGCRGKRVRIDDCRLFCLFAERLLLQRRTSKVRRATVEKIFFIDANWRPRLAACQSLKE